MTHKQRLTITAQSVRLDARLPKSHAISSRILPFFFVISSAWASQSLAQDLNLFEPIQSADKKSDRATEQLPRAGDTEMPAFSLMGITRIGSQRTVMLQHSSGSTVSVALSKGASSAIEKHSGYEVLLSESGDIAVQYPSSRVCAPAKPLGVSCDATNNRALLTMAAAEPLPVREVPRPENTPPEGGDAADEPPPNPFEVLRQRAARGQRGDVVTGEEQPGRFRPRRIDPDQIPEGKRVVSTPFGDRLVDR